MRGSLGDEHARQPVDARWKLQCSLSIDEYNYDRKGIVVGGMGEGT